MVKKVLVIDDKPYNIASARLTLKEFDLTTANSIEEAYAVLASGERFDVVLTDLYLPRGSFNHKRNLLKPGPSETMVPAGLVFAIRAANEGMRVIICTDSDHHQDVLCLILDLVYEGTGRWRGEGERKISFHEARTCHLKGRWENGEIVPSEEYGKAEDGSVIKDWHTALAHCQLVPYRKD